MDMINNNKIFYVLTKKSYPNGYLQNYENFRVYNFMFWFYIKRVL